MRAEVLEILLKMQDEDYKIFDDRLVKNGTGNPSIGVRVPDLKKLCKDIASEKYGEIYDFFKDIDKLLKENPESIYQEEHLLYGMLIGMGDMWSANREHCLEHWIPTVMSWKDCDCSVPAWKFVKSDLGYWYPYFYKWIGSDNEMAVRTALVVYMYYYINDDFIDRLLDIYSRDYSSFPYAEKAQAWGISVMYLKYPEQITGLFESKKLKASTQNLSIQKCLESYRISEEDKAELKKLKIKNTGRKKNDSI
ncbi:MAG: DNA alkylation repair protein [Eubacteriales bacterium]|nr:DNA alkylation repair protein [Eubacteriales bacterium]